MARDKKAILVVTKRAQSAIVQWVEEELGGHYSIWAGVEKDQQHGHQLVEQVEAALIIGQLALLEQQDLDFWQPINMPPLIVLADVKDKRARLRARQLGAFCILPFDYEKGELFWAVKRIMEPWVLFNSALPTEMHAITAHIDNRISYSPFYKVSDLCSDLAMSQPSLYRKVKSLSGKSPAQLIAERRLAMAGKLLNNTCESISEIAYKCGYSSPSYFARVFKRQLGISPVEYRCKAQSHSHE